MKKYCRKCGKLKDISEFHKNKQQADGLHPYCKECRNKAKMEYYEVNKEQILKQQAKYYYRKTFDYRLEKEFVKDVKLILSFAFKDFPK